MAFERVNAIEYAIVERLFTVSTFQARKSLENCLPLVQVIPQMLDRIKFGRIRRQKQELKIVRRRDGLVFVPTRTVEHHQDIFLRMSRTHFLQKYFHT